MKQAWDPTNITLFFFSALLLLTHVFSTGTFISKIGKELLGEEKEKIQVF